MPVDYTTTGPLELRIPLLKLSPADDIRQIQAGDSLSSEILNYDRSESAYSSLRAARHGGWKDVTAVLGSHDTIRGLSLTQGCAWLVS